MTPPCRVPYGKNEGRGGWFQTGVGWETVFGPPRWGPPTAEKSGRRVGREDSPLCPDCQAADYYTAHLFSCTTHQRTFPPETSGSDPARSSDGPRSLRRTLQATFLPDIAHLLTNGIQPEEDYRGALRNLHTTAVSAAIEASSRPCEVTAFLATVPSFSHLQPPGPTGPGPPTRPSALQLVPDMGHSPSNGKKQQQQPGEVAAFLPTTPSFTHLAPQGPTGPGPQGVPPLPQGSGSPAVSGPQGTP